MGELNPEIVEWINALPVSDQEAMAETDDFDREMELLIDLLKEGRDLKRLRDLFRKLSNDLDREDPPE